MLSRPEVTASTFLQLATGRANPSAIGAAVASLQSLDEERRRAYFDLLRYNLRDALDRALEALMTSTGEQHKYLSDFARKYYDDGEAKGEAKWKRAALVTVLAARDLTPTADERAKVDACSDVAILDTWITRAARASTVAEILAD